MASPTSTRTPAPRPSESAAIARPKQQQQQPPPPTSGVQSDAPPKKRKLEEVGFHRSPYYAIRAAVADLRIPFLQVCQETDSQKNDAVVDLLKEIKGIMEVSKKTRLDLSSAAQPAKQFFKAAAGARKGMPARKIPYAGKSQVPPISLASKGVPLKPDNSNTAAQRLAVETKNNAGPGGIIDSRKHLGKVLHGSFVIGGSRSGWNFLVWPGNKAVYYGLTKAEWLARKSAK